MKEEKYKEAHRLMQQKEKLQAVIDWCMKANTGINITLQFKRYGQNDPVWVEVPDGFRMWTVAAIQGLMERELQRTEKDIETL